MINWIPRWFTLLVVVAIVSLVLAACAPTAAPTPTSTKAPAATPTQAPAAAPTKAPEPTKPPAPSPTPPPKALEPVILGFINSFSGPQAAMGLPQRDTILMLEEKVNKEGGINGRPLKVIIYDDESDESKGVLAMKKLIESDKVHAVVGTSATGIAMAQAAIVEGAKVPWVTMMSAYAILVPPKTWIFKMPVSERLFIPAMYKFMKDRGWTRLALLSQGAGYGRSGRQYIEQTAPKEGITLVSKEEYGPADTDMNPQLTRIKGTNAQILLVYGAEPAGAIAVGQAKGLGLTIPALAPASLTLPFIMANEQLRRGLEGMYVATGKPDIWEQLPDNDVQKPVLKGLLDQLKAKYGAARAVSVWEAMGHDGFYIMVNAIKAANPDPAKLEEARSKIRDALEAGTKNFVGANTIITYTPTEHEGEPRLDTAVIVQVKEGKFVLVK